jgi:hypothetical protein
MAARRADGIFMDIFSREIGSQRRRLSRDRPIVPHQGGGKSALMPRTPGAPRQAGHKFIKICRLVAKNLHMSA